MPDIARLKAVLEIIEDEDKQPEGTSWQQNVWFRHEDGDPEKGTTCGTAMCFAGWAVYLDGYTKWVPPTGDDIGWHDAGRLLNPVTGNTVNENQVQNRARRLLDLNYDDSEALFRESNTLEDLRQMVANLANGVPARSYEEDDDWEYED